MSGDRKKLSVVAIAVALACAATAAPCASALVAQPLQIVLDGDQVCPAVADAGVVFQSSTVAGADSGFDIKIRRWAGGVEDVSSTSDDELAPRAAGNLVVFVRRPVPTGDPAVDATSSVMLADVGSGGVWTLSAGPTYKSTPAVYVGGGRALAVWAEFRSGSWDIMSYDLALDTDADGVPNYRDSDRPSPDPALVPIAEGPTRQDQPDVGQAGVVWREGLSVKLLRWGSGSAETLIVDAGTGSPEPATAGDLIVCSAKRPGASDTDIAVVDLRTGGTRWLGAAGVQDRSPVTDGQRVMWVSGDPPSRAVLLSSTEGTQQVRPSSADQSQPSIRSGRLAWTEQTSASGYDVWFAGWRDVPQTIDIAGADRIATAIEASKHAFPDGAEAVVIATSEQWPDALGGAALAGAVKGPLLLVPKDRLPDAVAAEIARLGAKKVYLLGGTGAVSASVQKALERMAPAEQDFVERIAGVDRYETARKVASRVVQIMGPDFGGVAFVARGDLFPDALGAGPLAAAAVRPVLLVDRTKGADAALIGTLKAANVQRVVVLGGAVAVPDSVRSTLEQLVPCSTERWWGPDRYETAAYVARESVKAGLRWDGLGIATGEKFPDALAAGPALATKGSVLLLTKTSSLPAATQAALSAHAAEIKLVRFFGGTGAISDAAREAVLEVFK